MIKKSWNQKNWSLSVELKYRIEIKLKLFSIELEKFFEKEAKVENWKHEQICARDRAIL